MKKLSIIGVFAAFLVVSVAGAGMATTIKGEKIPVTEEIAKALIPGEWTGIYRSVNPRTGEVYNNDPASYVLKADGTGTFEHPRASGSINWRRRDDGTLVVKYRRAERTFLLSREATAIIFRLNTRPNTGAGPTPARYGS